MLPLLTKNVKVFDIFVFLVVVGFILLSPAIWPASQSFVNENASLFLWTVVPYYFIGLTLDYNKHEDILLSVSRLALFIELFVQFTILTGLTNTIGRADDGTSGEQMNNAYGFIFAAIYLFIEADRNRRFGDILMASLAFILLLFMGARGPVVVYGFFIMGYYILFKRSSVWKKTLICLLFFVFYRFIDIILLLFLPLAQVLGFSTRVFDSIREGTFVNLEETNGREDIWEIGLEALQIHSNGYGWGGDRYVVVGDWSAFYGYAHNFELEILIQFGYILGGAILLFIVLLLAFSFFKTRGTRTCEFLFLLFCAGIMTLQTSQTYILQPLLFLLIGYSVAILRIPSKRVAIK